MNRIKAENAEVYRRINDTPEIDKLILIDRLVDPISALATQRTYEGIIDEIQGINYTEVNINPEVLGKAGSGADFISFLCSMIIFHRFENKARRSLCKNLMSF
jgi:hypothetical protein